MAVAVIGAALATGGEHLIEYITEKATDYAEQKVGEIVNSTSTYIKEAITSGCGKGSNCEEIGHDVVNTLAPAVQEDVTNLAYRGINGPIMNCYRLRKYASLQTHQNKACCNGSWHIVTEIPMHRTMKTKM
ncbi:hypothetical protein PoB_004495700 [Plakobranchus ocellatus]|uniref:Uncharacterized protein n=1 Tax=Plakobranchus ocellatus TaxID=259542 RepID=A0AAV4BHL2_9GAST|nr:hypothetical protein PoB_004495700 [Plakobranchus ocellatus]